MERKYRIKANVGSDNVLNVNLKQDIDLYEILSLEITKDDINNVKRESAYKLFSSDYGVVIGRVLANDAFGVPNARVSVFVSITEQDKLRSDIKNLYPYSFVTDYNKDKIRYNTLPDYNVSECHTPVGTFPSKRYMLDNDSILEVYDKYYKYTTVTNDAGDYMIFGVPTGEQIIHTDIDLSDIGILSQRPSDFLSKGYTETMFESSSKFKKSSNLDDLAQIFSDNTTVTVYPFWGDKNSNEIAITRKDIRLQYKFETSCVFFGSVITDNPNNSISHKCVPDIYVGDASQLMSSPGKIEMIRKNIDDVVEEYSINSNNLIDSDGVFCYQIPMNLDYIGTDEYGNIVPTDNPKKGIPTRARVRFRITLDETGSEALTTHKARYLIPNNPDLVESEVMPYVETDTVETNRYYEFGTNTPDECFRDLYWNKIYSVKCYIPRIQIKQNYFKDLNYLAIKGINKKAAAGINPMPYNKLNLNFGIPTYYLLRKIHDEDRNYLRDAWDFIRGTYNHYKYDSIRESIVEEMDAIGLDFYNDWINGCLYFPNWYWFTNTTYGVTDEERKEFCQCKNSSDKTSNSSNENAKVWVVNTGSLEYENEDFEFDDATIEKSDGKKVPVQTLTSGSEEITSGVIKKVLNKDNAEIFYYAFGSKIDDNSNNEVYTKYARLFSTDLILLGSITDNDFQGIPKLPKKFPSTTCKIPPMGYYKKYDETYQNDDDILEGNVEISGALTESDKGIQETDNISYNGMNWGSYWDASGGGQVRPNEPGFKYKYGSGLFFGIREGTYVLEIKLFKIWKLHKTISAIVAEANAKTYPNVERICELGVINDCNYGIKAQTPPESEDGRPVRYIRYSQIISMDGLITRREIVDHEIRSLFATLNSDRLIGKKYNEGTGYYKYDLYYVYPTDFDGRLNGFIKRQVTTKINDIRNKDYIDFRMGSIKKPGMERVTKHFYYDDGARYAFPLYDNSFYFYFGLNPGKTAIDKLYSKYLEECTRPISKDPFRIDMKSEGEDLCNSSAILTVAVSGYFTFPISISISSKSYNNEVINLYKTKYKFTDLPVGEYMVTVTDYYDNSISDTYVISTNPVSISVKSEKNISTDEESEEDVCETGNYGVIVIKSYAKNKSERNITTLTNGELKNENKVLKYNVNDESNLFLEISGGTGELIDDCFCSTDGNYLFDYNGKLSLRVKKTDTYYFKIYDTSVTGCDNYSINSAYISASDKLLLYINGIPTKYFSNSIYDGEEVTSVNKMLNWLNVNNPSEEEGKCYAKGFNSDNIDASATVWSERNPENIVSKRINSLFKISNATYISNGKHELDVTTKGNVVLLRSSHPNYDSYEGCVTCNTGKVTANNNEPNIIPNIDNSAYIFNNYYNDEVHNSGNYFACFENKAEIVDVVGRRCIKSHESYGFSKVPNNTNDLYELNEGFCTDEDIIINSHDIPSIVYSNGETKPYFRTEFIDRRLGYNLSYFSPTNYGDNQALWNRARISGYTYNGIEMAYNSDKRLISVSDNTEYTYSETTGKMELMDNEKSLYNSFVKIGNSNQIDITKAYAYDKRRTPDLNISDVSVITGTPFDLGADEFKNFGFNNNKPTKRLLDINLKPKGNDQIYSYSATSCSYSGDADINVTVKYGETVGCNFNNSDITFGEVDWNVSGTCSGTFSPTTFKIKLDTALYENNKFTKYALVQDDVNHSVYKAIKGRPYGSTNPIPGLITISSLTSNELTTAATEGFMGLVLYQELKKSDNPLKKISIYDMSKIFEIKKFTFEYSIGTEINEANTSTVVDSNGGHITSRGSTDGENPQGVTVTSQGIITTSGDADVKTKYIKANFTGVNVTDFKCKIQINGKNIDPVVNMKNGEAYIMCSGFDGDKSITSFEVWATIEGLIYYFKAI